MLSLPSKSSSTCCCPCRLFERAGETLRPGGSLLLTTPYHGYFKNLALAVTKNSFDQNTGTPCATTDT